MEQYYFFELNELPDFSLSKYSAKGLSSHSAVAQNNCAFLKQLHSLGLVYGLDFHLFYYFDPDRPKGRQLRIVLLCRGDEENGVLKNSIKDLISSMANNECYVLSEVSDTMSSELNRSFSSMVTLYKQERTLYPHFANESKEEPYCGVSEWKPRRDARMYNVFQMMENMNQPVAFRIDIIPEKDSEKIRDEITRRGIYSRLKNNSNYAASLTSGSISRDEAAGQMASFYDKYIKDMTAALQFRASICIFSMNSGIGTLIADVLTSEILEQGLSQKEIADGDFSVLHELTATKYIKESLFDISSIKYMKSLYTIEEIAPFFSFPYLNAGEHISIRKETDPRLTDKGIHIGNDQNGYNVMFPLENFAKHAYISGVPGSGKTYTMKHLIHSLHRNGIPFLVFEPAKKEYRGLYSVDPESKKKEYGEFVPETDDMRDVILFSPKQNSLFPLHINPFEVPTGVTVSEYISCLYNVFLGAFTWPSPTSMILRESLIAAYRENGLVGSVLMTEQRKKEVTFPTLTTLYDAFTRIMNGKSYEGDSKSTIKGILETRLGSLMKGDVGEVFNVTHSTISPEQWDKKSIFLELESLTNEHANFLTLLIISFIRLDIKVNPSLASVSEDVNDPRRVHNLRHVIFFEEAHNLIGPVATEGSEDNANSKLASTIFIKNMLAEVRAYKEGIVIADQLPSALAPEVLKNTSLKIAHRQSSLDERKLLGEVMSADSQQIDQIAKYTKGRSLMIYEDADLVKPFYAKVETHFEYKADSPDDVELLNMLGSEAWYDQIMSDSIIYKFNSFDSTYKRLERIFRSRINSGEGSVGKNDNTVSDVDGTVLKEKYYDFIRDLNDFVDCFNDLSEHYYTLVYILGYINQSGHIISKYDLQHLLSTIKKVYEIALNYKREAYAYRTKIESNR